MQYAFKEASVSSPLGNNGAVTRRQALLLGLGLGLGLVGAWGLRTLDNTKPAQSFKAFNVNLPSRGEVNVPTRWLMEDSAVFIQPGKTIESGNIIETNQIDYCGPIFLRDSKTGNVVAFHLQPIDAQDISKIADKVDSVLGFYNNKYGFTPDELHIVTYPLNPIVETLSQVISNKTLPGLAQVKRLNQHPIDSARFVLQIDDSGKVVVKGENTDKEIFKNVFQGSSPIAPIVGNISSSPMASVLASERFNINDAARVTP